MNNLNVCDLESIRTILANTNFEESKQLCCKIDREINRLKTVKIILKRMLNLTDMYKEILLKYGISENDLKSRNRERTICNIRFAVMVVLRQNGVGYSEAARIFGRDHCDTIHAIKRHENLMFAKEKEYMEIYSALKNVNVWEIIELPTTEENQCIKTNN